MPCQTIVGHTKGKPKLCGEPASTYDVTRSTYPAISVTVEFCPKHATKAEREGYVLFDWTEPSPYITRTNRSTHCQS